MANVLTGRVWSADTAGVLSTVPVWITAIGIIPSAAAGTITLSYWDEKTVNTLSKGYISASINTATITETEAAGDTDIFSAAAYPAGDILQIWSSTGSATNVGYKLIATVGDDERVIVTPNFTTNEGAFLYGVQSFPSRLAFIGLTQATTAMDAWYPFPQPIRFPNLVLTTATNAAVKIYFAQSFAA
jgi:hypothetical protein